MGTGMSTRRTLAALTLGTVIAAATACGGSTTADITADGSNTLGPLMQVAAERFERDTDVRVDIETSRSGRGFERFCAGELDIANASRPIDEDEQAACAEAGVEYVQLKVASDALTVAIHRPILYDWVTCLTVDQLRKIWEPDSKVSNWNQIDPSFPDVPLHLYGPHPESGTFRFFTFVVNGERGASRTDYSATEDHDDTVEGIAKERGALGYFGFSYFQRNTHRLAALEIDGGNGCVAPSVESVRDGSYQPLARELYVYVNQRALDKNRNLRSFVRYVLENARAIAVEELFVPLSEAEAEEQMQKLVEAIS
jgi:phosphate transport system substrate-binding protein